MNLLIPVLFLTTVVLGEVLCSKFHGPTALLPVVLHSGYLADTHEVAAAKSAHLATLSHQSHDHRYGHTDLPHVLQDGHIADTHEVAAAKAEHYSAVAKARAHGGYHHDDDFSGQYSGEYEHHSAPSKAYYGYGTHESYHGTFAKPVVLHDGHIADTHEVAAAKAEHFAAVAKARAYGGYHHGGDYSDQYAAGYDHYSGAYNGYGTHNSVHGSIAKPVVLPSGFLADTHEVAHAKQHHLKLLHSSSRSEYHSL